MEILETLPIHDCKSFIMECCDLINSEWPRSKSARLQSLYMSSEKFPASLILILNGDQVVGHVKLSELKLGGPHIMLESMIIRKDHRGKGWGTFLMKAAEKYVESRGKTKIYLSTRGQEGFYEKLGYEICEPILFFGFCDTTPKADEKHYTVMVKICKRPITRLWWINLQYRLDIQKYIKRNSKYGNTAIVNL